jgi:hypothetical protein
MMWRRCIRVITLLILAAIEPHARVERRSMSTTGATVFDIATLRARRTNKWHKSPPDVLSAWVADMDFGVAPSITAALARLTRDPERRPSPACPVTAQLRHTGLPGTLQTTNRWAEAAIT